MKARFTEKQPQVLWRPLPDGKVDVTICINEKQVTEEYQESVGGELGGIADLSHSPKTMKQVLYEYDFNQFRELQTNVDENDIRTNPRKYLNYIPEKEKSLEEAVQEQAGQIQMLTECLLEMSEMVYV